MNVHRNDTFCLKKEVVELFPIVCSDIVVVKDIVSPSVVLISCLKNNRQYYLATETLEKYFKYNEKGV